MQFINSQLIKNPILFQNSANMSHKTNKNTIGNKPKPEKGTTSMLTKLN